MLKLPLPLPAITREKDFEAATCFESVTITVKGNVPAALGVPSITPAELRVMPGGSVPVDDHVSGAVPPLAVNVKR